LSFVVVFFGFFAIARLPLNNPTQGDDKSMALAGLADYGSSSEEEEGEEDQPKMEIELPKV